MLFSIQWYKTYAITHTSLLMTLSMTFPNWNKSSVMSSLLSGGSVCMVSLIYWIHKSKSKKIFYSVSSYHILKIWIKIQSTFILFPMENSILQALSWRPLTDISSVLPVSVYYLVSFSPLEAESLVWIYLWPLSFQTFFSVNKLPIIFKSSFQGPRSLGVAICC